jgi:hypothetical protein
MLKTVSSIANAIGALNYKGTWNASTNIPTLASGVGTKGDYYIVSVAGATTLDGISNWGVGDWAAYNGSVWQRVEGGADLNGVNLSVSGTTTLSGLTASTALALDASKNVISVVQPAFSARNSTNQSISSGTFTKVTLDTEDFDTNSNFASSTFTPTVAGYYQINCIVRVNGVAVTGSAIAIYKNGSAFTRVAETNSSIGNDFTLAGSSIVSCNGTTDTIEMYANITATSPNFNFANDTACCRMSGTYLRGL